MQNAKVELLNKVGSICMSEVPQWDSDNLAIALCTYFDNHPQKPDNDPDGEHGWSEWVERMVDRTLNEIVNQLMQETGLKEVK